VRAATGAGGLTGQDAVVLPGRLAGVAGDLHLERAAQEVGEGGEDRHPSGELEAGHAEHALLERGEAKGGAQGATREDREAQRLAGGSLRTSTRQRSVNDVHKRNRDRSYSSIQRRSSACSQSLPYLVVGQREAEHLLRLAGHRGGTATGRGAVRTEDCRVSVR